ncbi:hydrolase [Streptomyces sp. NPDC050997]|uniref:hydrolase n=1 Tax=Streptomyces sp. NPDC050997 TaxID=3155519 RepID=UPI003433B721
MSLWTSLEPASATVDPGSSTRIRLRLRNTGDVVDEYRFEPVGAVAPWTTVEPPTLRLYPGTTGTVELTFAPPRTPDATAGPNPFAVRITPTEHPDAVTVPEGTLTITPFSEVRAELVPHTVKGRFRGRPRLAIDNLGNTKVTASLSGSDTGDRLSYEIQPANVQIEPGRATFVNTTLRPRQIIWFGSKEEQPYRLAVRRSGVQPTEVDGTYVQRGFLPRWLATALSIMLALAIAFVMIWISYQPRVASLADAQSQEVGSTLAPPSPSATPTPPPQPSVTPTTPVVEETQDAAAGEGGGGGGGGGGGTATVTAQPPQDTAATAVNRLAKDDPTGRHICYRAFVTGDGWQKPVCDGTFAGTTGQNKPIKALNIAVYGAGGSAANAFLHNPESTDGKGRWSPSWTAIVADGKNNYIGSSKKDAPDMLGFAINIGSGKVCQTARVHGFDWGAQGCADPRPRYIFGGALENDRWLEAVKFTV